MTNTSLQPVAPGQKVQADTINKIIKSTDFGVKTTGALTHIGKDVNIQVLNPGQNDFSGQKFREPFDLSVSQTATGIQYTVLRPELYLWGSYRSIKNDLTVTFPSENDQHVGIYISCDAGCSPESYGLAKMEASETVNFMIEDSSASLQAATPSLRAGATSLKRITGIKPSWKTMPRTLRDTWSKVGRYALQNPTYKGDGSLEEPAYRKYLKRPIEYDHDRDTVLTGFWDKEEEASEVLNTPGGPTEADVTANDASEYDDTGEKYASSPHAWLIWQFMPNGTIVEDSRSMAIPAAEDMYFKATRPTKLDLSSLNWKVVYPTDPNLSAKYAQNFHYDAPREEDLVDLKKVKADAQTSTSEISTCVDKWRFLVRPEEGIGEGTLHYASLSDVLSAISSEGGGCECDLEPVLTSGTKIARWTPDGQNWTDIYAPSGGGSECSCDLSAEPATQMSSIWAPAVKTASWTKDDWQTQKDIYVPDFGDACTYFNLRNTYSAFAYYPTMNTVAQGMILNCAFWYGRRWETLGNIQVSQPGTYYLEVDTQYTTPSFTIRHDSSTLVPPPKSLINSLRTDTKSIFPLWVIPDAVQTLTTGIPFDCRTALNLPFYSD